MKKHLVLTSALSLALVSGVAHAAKPQHARSSSPHSQPSPSVSYTIPSYIEHYNSVEAQSDELNAQISTLQAKQLTVGTLKEMDAITDQIMPLQIHEDDLQMSLDLSASQFFTLVGPALAQLRNPCDVHSVAKGQETGISVEGRAFSGATRAAELDPSGVSSFNYSVEMNPTTGGMSFVGNGVYASESFTVMLDLDSKGTPSYLTVLVGSASSSQGLNVVCVGN